VGALVEHIAEGEVTLQLVNLDPVQENAVSVQAGAYAEHQITHARVASTDVPVNHSHVTVRLAAGAGARLILNLERYVNQPTFAAPWV
jgi:hypothetical protein